MNSEGTHYPDSEPDGLGDLKEIKRVPEMSARAPAISWGQTYLDWPVEKRLDYAEKLAASMNHAADILQKERNKLIAVASAQETQLKQAAEKLMAQNELMHKELGRAGAEHQESMQLIVKLTAEIKELKKHVKRLEGEG